MACWHSSFSVAPPITFQNLSTPSLTAVVGEKQAPATTFKSSTGESFQYVNPSGLQTVNGTSSSDTSANTVIFYVSTPKQ